MACFDPQSYQNTGALLLCSTFGLWSPSTSGPATSKAAVDGGDWRECVFRFDLRV